MKYLLDTNICIYIIKKKPEKVWSKFQSLSFGEIGVSSITVAELEYGVYKSKQINKNKNALEQFLLPLKIIPFEQKSTAIYGQIRNNLEKEGKVIGSMDMLIASQALALDLILVTNNVKEFARISKLVIENWVE